MPSLIDIRRRIRAVKSTQQITKAMKMVAASKLRRSQDRIFNARPYAREMRRVLAGLAARVDPSAHPLLDRRDPDAASGGRARMLLVVISADKGLCGSFNTNVVKAASTEILAGEGRPVVLALVGRKGRDFFRRRGFPVVFERVGLFQGLKYADAQEIAQAAMEEFTAKRVDSVQLVYNEFKSVMQQRVMIEALLPIPRETVAAAPPDSPAIDYLYEPGPQEICDRLLPRYVETQVYRALLESNAAFFAAQMTAMDTANKNATEMIGQLTLFMNKVRQAAITREIIEVVSGAGAL
jgi:F-type H+-transporting ATPase subunit gamma